MIERQKWSFYSSPSSSRNQALAVASDLNENHPVREILHPALDNDRLVESSRESRELPAEEHN